MSRMLIYSFIIGNARSEGSERSERSERPERSERSERSERAERRVYNADEENIQTTATYRITCVILRRMCTFDTESRS